jgi:hypothetical protein
MQRRRTFNAETALLYVLRLGSEAARQALAGAREVLLQGSFYEVSLALVGVASLAYFQY